MFGQEALSPVFASQHSANLPRDTVLFVKEKSQKLKVPGERFGQQEDHINQRQKHVADACESD
jgi:hypothetical protein